MKVLSIKEPFATLIKDGVKIYETRSWKTNYRGEIYIHASKSLSKSENVETANKYLKSEINPGYILCRCELVDCIPMTDEFIEYICYIQINIFASNIKPLSCKDYGTTFIRCKLIIFFCECFI